MSSSAKVWLDQNTKVICQGFTGKQGAWRVVVFLKVCELSQVLLLWRNATLVLYYCDIYCDIVNEAFSVGFSNSAASVVDVFVLGISFSIGWF